MKIVWLPAAAYALDREYEYLASKNPKAARQVFSRIIAMVRRLGDFPNSGRIGQIAGTRELVIPTLPYMLIYRVNGDRVEIHRLFHPASDWPERMT